ncbi:BTAD domain-containing putative transcriptional regulator [Burkholderia plantarii]|uniref:BTAD domain-containing putative transcriptional regulator n=1 Tax=Burkholderia plantarii TaxID=41899 RepID=UPI0018DCC849|nr:BTAD domain-containing putative transcriptional regulator [Burkholderia plantarii]MBI0330429.1 tetratricopeptide repeat protein [Burkholderia plantarii]
MDAALELAREPAEHPPLELRLLGPFEFVDHSSNESIAIPATKLRALLAYLAAAPRHGESRRTLARLLWAGKDDDLARQSLRQLLSQLRRSPDPRVARAVEGSEAHLRLDCARMSIDRTVLLGAPADAPIAALMKVVQLYRGDFMAGLETGEAEYDAWLNAERTRCLNAAVHVIDRLVRMLIDGGRHEEALHYANRLAEIDPLREQTHRLVIGQEAAVSGRASAMSRFEHFRALLEEELGVRPEAATLQMVDALRQPPRPAPAGPEVVSPAPGDVERPAASTELDETAPPARPGDAGISVRRRVGPLVVGLFVAGLVAVVLVAVVLGMTFARREDARGPGAAADSRGPAEANAQRAAVLVAPFTIPAGMNQASLKAGLDEPGVKALFAGNARLSLVEWPPGQGIGDPLRVAREHHALYVITTDLRNTPDGPRADAVLFDAATGTRIFAAPTMLTGDANRFARSFYESLYPAVLLYHAHRLAERDPNAVATLLFEAAVERERTGVRAADPPEMAQLEAVVARDPDNLEALLGLSRSLILRAALDLSKGLNRLDDLWRASWRLAQAERLAQVTPPPPATMSDIAFLGGMLDKLENRFPEAAEKFGKALALAPGNSSAAAELAHLMLLTGRTQEAYARMESIPNPDVADYAFIAGETALMAGHPGRALFYYDKAVSANPAVPRNHAWRSVALWRLHREAEAHLSALKSQETAIAYLPSWMGARAQYADKRYRDARNECVKDFEKALSYETGTPD